MILIISLVSIVLIAFCTTFTYTLLKSKLSFKLWNSNKEHTVNRTARLRASKVLGSMVNGIYTNQELKFSEHECAICLDIFDPQSQVHVINECNHCFHSKCLKKFFIQVKNDYHLKCPCCNCEICEDSEHSLATEVNLELEEV